MIEARARIIEDGARGLVRLSRADLARLGLHPGDPVRLNGTRQSVGRVMPAALTEGEMQVDQWLARNAGLADGVTARITGCDLPPLDAVMFGLEGAGAANAERLADRFYDMALNIGDTFPLDGDATATVRSLGPGEAGILTGQTVITLEAPPEPALGYEGLGGLDEELARVHEMIAAPLLRPELYAHLGLSAPRGVLFSGPPGSGKTLLARAVAGRTKAAFFHVNAPEIVTKHYGESEAALRKVFEAAAKSSPAIIFIDEIDAIAPAREALSGEKQVERRLVAQLLTLLDGLSDRGQIVVMAATNLPDSLDPALRRPGRFDREIRFRPPTQAGRADILRVHLARTPLAADVDLEGIAAQTHGYVGADLAALAREAAVTALARSVAQAGGEARVQLDSLKVTQADLLRGLDQTAPSALRADEVDGPAPGWAQVAGLDGVKALLKQAVIAPQRMPELYDHFAVTPPTGILLAGPPGTGKTLIARALAGEAGMNFLPVRPPRLLSQYFGEAERAVAQLFARARQTAPTLLFFDEFDSVAPRRGGDAGIIDRIVAQLLVELDGGAQNRDLVVLAATNRPDAIDPALTRPGRFDLVIEIPLPDRAARRAILDVHLQDRPMAATVDLDALAASTEGVSGAGLAALARLAAQTAVGRVIAGTSDRGTCREILPEDVAQARAMLDGSDLARRQNHITPEVA